MSDVTRILDAVQAGEGHAAAELLEKLYDELRKLAVQRMAREPAGQTLQATALVHEAWLRLVGSGQEHWQNRGHFFAAAAEAMRRIMIDRARRKAARRHGGGMPHVDIDEVEIAAGPADDDLLMLNEALEKFAQLDPEKAQLVKLRYFAGLTNEEAAPLLGISVPTAKRWWAYARAWLFNEVRKAQ